MRIRLPFAIAFFLLLLFSSSAGLLPHSSLPKTPEAAKKYIPPQSDKALHFVSFFALSSTFYFIIDTARRRVLHLTLFVCTLCLGVGSEVAQGALPNGREFDPWDVLANVLGSLVGIMLCSVYHKRAAERRRRAKYSTLVGEGVEGEDLELGDGPGVEDELGRTPDGQETGVVSTAPTHRSVEEELSNWDENVPDDDWDEEDDTAGKDAKMTPATSSAASEEIPPKKVEKMAVD